MSQENRSPFQTRSEDEDEVRSLGDLIDARENPSQDDVAVTEIMGDDEDLDIDKALTFPQPKRTQRDTESDDLTDFDADARTSSEPDDEDDASYMTREDFVDSMGLTDPDPNEGADEDDFIGDAGIDRAPDMTGTVTGITRGLGTHLPQDFGSGGFQIEDPEAGGDPRLVGMEEDDEDVLLNAELDEDEDGGQIPTSDPAIGSRDDALDATRRIE